MLINYNKDTSNTNDYLKERLVFILFSFLHIDMAFLHIDMDSFTQDSRTFLFK